MYHSRFQLDRSAGVPQKYPPQLGWVFQPVKKLVFFFYADLQGLPRVYLKTHDVTGSEGFLRCARHFFAGILTYFKEK